MGPEKLYQLGLKYIPGVGPKTIKHLISYCGSAESIFRNTKGKLKKIPGIGEKTIEIILKSKALRHAEEELKTLDKNNVSILFYTDREYPYRLRRSPDAPVLFYYKGNTDFNPPKVVSIVGSRSATDYGKMVTEKIIQGLQSHQSVIVSGLAYGIDIHAHNTAMKNSLETWAIIGSGLDMIYPSSHLKYSKKMENKGAVITEYPLGTKPEASHFPERNRIIAGISDATIVIEASEKGGALITAEIANSYHKDVFAVPGPVGEITSTGCNNLIKNNKAHLITSVEDLEFIMQWDKTGKSYEEKIDLTSFNREEIEILRILSAEALQIDQISYRSNIGANKLANILLNLEFKGVIISLPGKKYKLSQPVVFNNER